MIRRLAIVASVMVALVILPVVLAFVLWLNNGANPKGANPTAKRLEQRLLEMPVRLLDVPGGELLDESSAAMGRRPGFRNARPPDSGPYVLRSYSYEGSMVDVCEEIVEQLDERFGFSGSCRVGDPPPTYRRFEAVRYCEGLRIDIVGLVRGPDFPNADNPDLRTRQTVALQVFTPYPTGGTTPSLPADVPEGQDEPCD